MGVYVLLANTTITILSINFTNVLLSDHFLDQIEMVIHFFLVTFYTYNYIFKLCIILGSTFFSVPEINV